jgi:hypothetical protein
MLTPEKYPETLGPMVETRPTEMLVDVPVEKPQSQPITNNPVDKLAQKQEEYKVRLVDEPNDILREVPREKTRERILRWIRIGLGNEKLGDRDIKYPIWGNSSRNIFFGGDKDSKYFKNGGFWWWFGRVVRRGEFSEGISRPPAARAKRAEAYHKIKKLAKERQKFDKKLEKQEKKELYLKNRIAGITTKMDLVYKNSEILDDLNRQFVTNIKRVIVDMGKFGEQEAQCVTIVPKNINLDNPPIWLIPGIATGVEGPSIAAATLAMSTKSKVITIAQPDSLRGKVTQKLADEIKNSNNIDLMATFLKEAFKYIIKNETKSGEKKVDVYAISLGCLEIDKMVKDADFNKIIGQINLISPPGIVNMNNKVNYISGLLLELGALIFNRDSIISPKSTSAIQGRVEETLEKKKARKDTRKNIYNIAKNKSEWWNNEFLTKERKVKVTVGRMDGVTLGFRMTKKIPENMTVRRTWKGHITEGRKPELYI